jgi:hypothetical protein
MTTYQPPALSAIGQQIADRQFVGAHDQELAAASRYVDAARRQKMADNKVTSDTWLGGFVLVLTAVAVALWVLWLARQYAPASLTSWTDVVDQFRALPAKYDAVRLSWDNLIHLRALTSSVGVGLNG